MKFLTILLCLISISAHAGQDYISVQTPKDRQIEAIRNEEIRTCWEALALRKEDGQKAELYLRLAKSYKEAFEADFALEGRLLEKALKTDPNARFKRERSNQNLKKGIEAAEKMLSLPKVSVEDKVQAHYFLGYNYGALDDKQKSRDNYEALVRIAADSKLAFDAFQSLGDDAFKASEFDRALKYYEQAMSKTKDVSQRARLLHKISWCHYRMKQYPDAIAQIKKAIAIAKAGDDKLFNPNEEGLRDLSVFYASIGKSEEAIDYFEKTVGETKDDEAKLISVLENLGKEYNQAGRTADSRRVFEVLLKKGQGSEISFRVLVRLIELDLLKENYETAISRLNQFQAPSKKDAETDVLILNLRNLVRDTAVRKHEIYRKSLKKEDALPDLEIAEKLYLVQLNRFVNSKKENSEIRMYLADVSEKLKKPEAAAALYKRVIQDKDPEYASLAAQRWVGNIHLILVKHKKEKRQVGSEPYDLEREYIEASDLLESSIPKSKESLEARINSVKILAVYPSEREAAIARASKFTKSAPETREGVEAAIFWLKLEPTAPVVTTLKSMPVLLDTDRNWKGELAKTISEKTLALRLDEADSLITSGSHLEAAKKFEALAVDSKNDPKGEDYYSSAIFNYAQAGSLTDVIRVKKSWMTHFPKSKKVEKEIRNLSSIFFISGKFVEAAELNLDIAKQFVSFNAYMAAALLFEGSKEYAKAIDAYSKALGVAKNDEERAKVHQGRFVTYSLMKDGLGRFNAMKSCFDLNSSMKADCGSRLGKHYLENGDNTRAADVFKKVVSIRKPKGVDAFHVAYAQYKLAEFEEISIKHPPLQLPMDQFIKAFKSRQDGLNRIFNAYRKVTALSGPWVISAIERGSNYKLALAEEFETAVQKMGKNLPEAETKYLQELSVQYRKEALAETKQAFTRAMKDGILSKSMPTIHDRLVDEGVPGFYRSQGQRLGLRIYGIESNGGKEGADAAIKRIRETLLKPGTKRKPEEIANDWINYGNLLWGMGYPSLSGLAYDKAIEIGGKKVEAMVNLATNDVLFNGIDDWLSTNIALQTWKNVLKSQKNNVYAIYNIGHLYNYYRMFDLAERYLKQLDNNNIADVHEGLAVIQQSLGNFADAKLHLEKAEELGKRSGRFVRRYLEAAQNESEPKKCRSALSSIDRGQGLNGFEQLSVEHLEKRCAK
jgi:tetratricopeptide (TPR) repeat protein